MLYLTSTSIFSKWWHLFCSSVSHWASPQLTGGADDPDILHQAWGILRWYRSSATDSTSGLHWSPSRFSSVAFLMAWGHQKQIPNSAGSGAGLVSDLSKKESKMTVNFSHACLPASLFLILRALLMLARGKEVCFGAWYDPQETCNFQKN